MNRHLLPLSEIAQLLKTTPSGIDNVTAVYNNHQFVGVLDLNPLFSNSVGNNS